MRLFVNVCHTMIIRLFNKKGRSAWDSLPFQDFLMLSNRKMSPSSCPLKL